MARASRPIKGGPGNLVLGILIALCALLICGYVALLSQFAKRGSELIEVQKYVKQNLEDPLKKFDPSLRAHSTPSAYDLAYDSAFFSKVGKDAEDGMAYADLLKLTGYDSIAAATDELKKVPELSAEQENLKAYISKLRDDYSNLDRQFSQVNSDLHTANAARDEAQALEKTERANLEATLVKSDKDLKDAQGEYNKSLALINEKLNEADQDAKKAWAENHAEADRFKKEIAALDVQMQGLKDQLDVAQHELEIKRPKKVAVAEGHILQADPVEGYAVIDLGKRDGIQNGEKFSVVTIGKGDVRIPKGELQVVRVDELVSRAEVVESQAGNPIMRGDIVEREKKTE